MKLQLLALFVLCCFPSLVCAGPLADYVARQDDSYHWKHRRSGKIANSSYSELILTSQTWRGITWKHQLFIILPKSAPAEANQAVLLISGGDWSESLAAEAGADEALPKDARMLALVAEQLQTPLAVLMQVPQQPMFGGKREDAIISMTFENYLRSGEEDWPLLLPMVKSAVRGMDAVQAFVQKEWNLKIDSFTVTGASKRGWTTWLTAATDPRVQALAPMVIDMLNMSPQMKHQVAAWGKFSDEISEYTERGLQKVIDTPGGKKLQAIVDPYQYREQIKQPKLILLGTNDAYWPLDAANLYFNDLAGEKRLLYIPNNGHSLRDYPRMVGSIAALHHAAGQGKPLPEVKGEFEEGVADLKLTISSDVPQTHCRAWVSSSPTRDFRRASWSFHNVEKTGGSYTFTLPRPATGFVALFGEAEYAGVNIPYFLSTNVRIFEAGEGQ